jgi:hypothetical protein
VKVIFPFCLGQSLTDWWLGGIFVSATSGAGVGQFLGRLERCLAVQAGLMEPWLMAAGEILPTGPAELVLPSWCCRPGAANHSCQPNPAGLMVLEQDVAGGPTNIRLKQFEIGNAPKAKARIVP